MRKAIIIFVVILLIVAISWGINQAIMLEKTCYKSGGYKLNKLGFKDTDIDLKLLITNKSDIDYEITKQNYKVYIDGKEVSQVQSKKIKGKEGDSVAAGATSPLNINVRFNPSKTLASSVADFVMNGDIKVRLKGTVTIKKALFSYPYPVDIVFNLKDLTSPSEPC